MSKEKLIEKIEILSGENDPEILEIFLEIAQSEILSRRFPFGDRPEEFPSEYEVKAIKIASFLINKMGAEGETEHTVDGVKRVYGGADIPEDMLKDIIPLAKVVGK